MAISEKELKLSEEALLRSAKNVVRALEICLRLPVANKEALEKLVAAARTSHRILPLTVPGQNNAFRLLLNRNCEPVLLELRVSHVGAVDLGQVRSEFLKFENSNPHLEVQFLETGHEEAKR